VNPSNDPNALFKRLGIDPVTKVIRRTERTSMLIVNLGRVLSVINNLL
jgi:hypothetical protein